MNNKNKIFIFSASDRYNFGDLLFNYVVYYFLTDDVLRKYKIIFSSISGNNLENILGHKTISIKKMLKILIDGDIIIFAGGGLLGHTWLPMFRQTHNSIIVKIIIKYFSEKQIEKFLKKIIFKTKNNYPFIWSKDKLNKNVKIIYNSVGGGALNNKSKKELYSIRKLLNNCDYLSVRDNNIKNIIATKNVQLSPDSAILFSDIFTKENLLKQCDHKVQKMINKNYIIIHFNKRIANKYYFEINNLMYHLKKKYDYTIYLLPVNFINNSDRIGQMKFKNIEICELVNKDLNLFEIIALIAHSKFLLGSSLHTNILACSYCVPHLGFSREILKVNNFFKTWYKYNEIFNSYDIHEIYKIIPLVLKNEKIVSEVSMKLKTLARKNFVKINSLIEN